MPSPFSVLREEGFTREVFIEENVYLFRNYGQSRKAKIKPIKRGTDAVKELSVQVKLC